MDPGESSDLTVNVITFFAFCDYELTNGMES